MKKIVMVEDDQFIQDFVSQKLLDAGYSVSVCADGEEAMGKILAEAPVVVLLDLDLPNLSGQEILTSLREQSATKDLPVIIFSNHDDPTLRESLLAAGANAFYLKAATDPAELIKVIESVLKE